MYVAVHMVELLHVEERVALGDIFEAEAFDDLAKWADLDAVGRAPPEQREIVGHRLRQVAAAAVLLDGDVVAPLGQLLALLVHQLGQVGEDRLTLGARDPADMEVLRRSV